MQAQRLGNVLRRQWIRALVAAGLAFLPTGPLAALNTALADIHAGVAAFSLRNASKHGFPAFARQTGLACSTCHFQKYPALTSFGRDFKAAGYTMMGPQEAVKGDRLSLPAVLNGSVFLKVRYQKTNGTDAPGERTTNAGELQFPDEFALLLGGRVSNNAGFMIEGQLADHSAPLVAGFKMPFTFPIGTSIRANIIPFTTDALGVAYGFELLNTGAVRNVRVNENRNAISAQQYISTATAAEGLAFVIVDTKWFINVSKWSPNHFAGAGGVANGVPTATYFRGAFMPTVGTWDLGVGIQSWMGKAGTANAAGTGIDVFQTKAFALDAQAQGAVGGLPLGVYLTHGKADATASGATRNLFNSRARDRSASTVTAELGVSKTPFLTVLGGFRSADNGRAAANSTDNAVTFGVNWMVAQNVGVHWIFNRFSGSAYAAGQGPMVPGGSGNMLNTLMLSAGF